MTPEEMAKRIAELEAQQAQANQLSFKVSDKNAVSVYGLQQFPTTLYYDQWERIFANVDAMRQFISKNKHMLVTKRESQNRR